MKTGKSGKDAPEHIKLVLKYSMHDLICDVIGY